MKFDIILPTMGRETLGNAIDSVLAQEYHDWTLQVVFDRTVVGCGCEDHYKETFTDPRIHWWYIPIFQTNWSGTAARNVAIKRSKSPWIAYIDDDDEWLPHHLKTLVELADGGYDLLHTRGRMVCLKHRHPRTSKRIRKATGVTTDDPTTVGLAHTRKLFELIPGGWQSLNNHDHVLFRKMIEVGGKLNMTQEITYEFLR